MTILERFCETKKNKPVVDEFDDDGSGLVYYNPLVNSNILWGERNLWDDEDQRYLVMEKMTLSGRHQMKIRSLSANRYGRSALRDTAAPKYTRVY